MACTMKNKINVLQKHLFFKEKFYLVDTEKEIEISVI